MKTVIVRYLIGGAIRGSYPVLQDVRMGAKRAEKLARDWCERSQSTYVSHFVADDGRTRKQEEADYRAMCRAEYRRTVQS